MLSAVINGTTYRKGTVVICGMEGDIPKFGRIDEIVVTPHLECFFVLSTFITIAFEYHYHAYEVFDTRSTSVYHHTRLFDYHPLVCTKVIGRDHSVFISMKYHLFS